MAENKDNNITSVMEALVKGAESVFTTKTVVGEATKIDDTIIIPLVDVSFGIGAGSFSGEKKEKGIGDKNPMPFCDIQSEICSFVFGRKKII